MYFIDKHHLMSYSMPNSVFAKNAIDLTLKKPYDLEYSPKVKFDNTNGFRTPDFL